MLWRCRSDGLRKTWDGNTYLLLRHRQKLQSGPRKLERHIELITSNLLVLSRPLTPLYPLIPFKGCGRAIRDLLDLRAGLAIGISSASILTQLFTITLAALMFCSIYHWRANARPVTPVKSRPGSPVNIYHQRARSRTPIVI